jgi:cyclohexa-1,5-dienecarbonyl-CoA hydratase
MALEFKNLEHGAIMALTLANGRGNVLDHALISRLREAIEDADGDNHLRAVLIDASGKDFCFGASVEEHRPENCDLMLGSLHGLLQRMVDLPLPVLVAVHGKCLGGGLELALAGSRIFAHPGASFGQPEVKLGVFAPAASALLAERVGPAAAEDLLLTGRTINAAEARALRLVDEVCSESESPADHALSYARANLLDHSRSALRYATRAARLFRAETLRTRLHTLEKLYLGELMRTDDAKEGIAAFIEKRSPQWTHAPAPSAPPPPRPGAKG